MGNNIGLYETLPLEMRLSSAYKIWINDLVRYCPSHYQREFSGNDNRDYLLHVIQRDDLVSTVGK